MLYLDWYQSLGPMHARSLSRTVYADRLCCRDNQLNSYGYELHDI